MLLQSPSLAKGRTELLGSGKPGKAGGHLHTEHILQQGALCRYKDTHAPASAPPCCGGAGVHRTHSQWDETPLPSLWLLLVTLEPLSSLPQSPELPGTLPILSGNGSDADAK